MYRTHEHTVRAFFRFNFFSLCLCYFSLCSCFPFPFFFFLFSLFFFPGGVVSDWFRLFPAIIFFTFQFSFLLFCVFLFFLYINLWAYNSCLPLDYSRYRFICRFSKTSVIDNIVYFCNSYRAFVLKPGGCYSVVVLTQKSSHLFN